MIAKGKAYITELAQAAKDGWLLLPFDEHTEKALLECCNVHPKEYTVKVEYSCPDCKRVFVYQQAKQQADTDDENKIASTLRVQVHPSIQR